MGSAAAVCYVPALCLALPSLKMLLLSYRTRLPGTALLPRSAVSPPAPFASAFLDGVTPDGRPST